MTHAKHNQLVAALPGDVYDQWRGQWIAVEMPLGDVLHHSGSSISHVYFPTSSIFSLVHILESGASAKVPGVGNEGSLGMQLSRLCTGECLVAATSKQRRYGSDLGEISPAPENVLNRGFSASAPNEKWLTDITEFQIPAGKVNVLPLIDCFDDMVVSWSIGTRPNAELVNTMLDAAVEKITASGDRPVVYSDRGGHYRWPGWLGVWAAEGKSLMSCKLPER